MIGLPSSDSFDKLKVGEDDDDAGVSVVVGFGVVFDEVRVAGTVDVEFGVDVLVDAVMSVVVGSLVDFGVIGGMVVEEFDAESLVGAGVSIVVGSDAEFDRVGAVVDVWFDAEALVGAGVSIVEGSDVEFDIVGGMVDELFDVNAFVGDEDDVSLTYVVDVVDSMSGSFVVFSTELYKEIDWITDF